MPDLDIVEFVEEAVEITNKPPLSGKWGMYVLFVDQPMGVDSVFVTIESEKQKRDGMLVSPSGVSTPSGSIAPPISTFPLISRACGA